MIRALNFNVILLMGCQLVGALGSIILVTLGGIVGGELAGNPALATLPISIMVVCVALTTVPAALTMKRIGRRRGFMLSAAVGASGVLLVALALVMRSFVLLCAGTAMYGCHMAFVLQYRFAAVESVGVAYASRAISIVLLGAIGGAVLGPILIASGRDAVGDTPYLGTMLMLASALVLVIFVVAFLRAGGDQTVAERSHGGRTLGQIASQPAYGIAVLCAGVGYGVMTFIMTATPLSMYVHDGYSIEQTAGVVRSHVIAMYAPSLFSGYLMERFGVRRVMNLGATLLLVTVAVGFAGHELLHYQLALVALGVGWNFLYVGGTTVLTRTYVPSERFKSQALNDLVVFSMSATASLLSGTVMGLFGWDVVLGAALAPLLVVLGALFYLRAHPELSHRRVAA